MGCVRLFGAIPLLWRDPRRARRAAVRRSDTKGNGPQDAGRSSEALMVVIRGAAEDMIRDLLA